jgi:hypothetical protein
MSIVTMAERLATAAVRLCVPTRTIVVGGRVSSRSSTQEGEQSLEKGSPRARWCIWGSTFNRVLLADEPAAQNHHLPQPANGWRKAIPASVGIAKNLTRFRRLFQCASPFTPRASARRSSAAEHKAGVSSIALERGCSRRNQRCHRESSQSAVPRPARHRYC